MRGAPWIVLHGMTLSAALAACGARTELDGPSAEALDVDPTGETCSVPVQRDGASCAPLRASFPIEQACNIETCTPLDAEGFASLPSCSPDPAAPGFCPSTCELAPEEVRVLAVNGLGRGHVIGACDSTTAEVLIERFEAMRYLGRSSAPRVASIGAYPCNEGLGLADYLGTELPAEYDDAATLADVYDVLVVCTGQGGLETVDFGPRFAEIVAAFVAHEGGGLLALADYICGDEAVDPGFAQLNAVVGLAGFRFTKSNFGYGEGHVDAACVPDYRP
jgi:hypothetical protein